MEIKRRHRAVDFRHDLPARPASIAQRLLPVLSWLPGYRRDWLLPDVLAGLAVWAVMVPESMAYAGILGVPPVIGLYTIVPPLIAYALLGTSRLLVVGPETATGLISALTVGAIAVQGTAQFNALTFRAAGRQPIVFGGREAFPDWQPADEKGDEAQLLPALRNDEIAQLRNPTIEDKETRPPPRYNEGTLIEAMRNAWRFVDDEVLRERLKEAKGIGTPATRAEIIGGLKKQVFLIAQGKNIVPTETGMSLFGVLKQADPALVDPGVTAQLECLLDEVVVGKQEMVGAIDAVCDVAQRIIGKLKDGASAGGPPLLGAAVGGDTGGRPPTPAMKRFANSIARQKRTKPPPGYTKSGSICRAFLDQHAPQKAEVATSGELGSKLASPAQMLFAEKIARERGIVIPDETKASSAAVSAWIASNLSTDRGKGRRKTDNKPPRSTALRSTAPKKRLRKRTAAAAGGPATPARQNAGTGRVAGHSDGGIRD